jgi:hypothetical protein
VAVPRAWSQQQAVLSGTVTDPSGAVIPGAAINLTNVATDVTTTATTNSTGYYVMGNLIPGTYTVRVGKEGFKTAMRSELTLQVAQSATADFQLELGQTTQQVSVLAAPPLVERTDGIVGQVVGPTTMVEMPLNGRNYFNLAELSPGVTSYGLRSGYSGAVNDYGTSFISGSGGEDRNAFSLDGADVQTYQNSASYIPSIDVIQEFKIETSAYAADLGTSPGAQVLLQMKTGTNKLHGDAYEFLRNSDLNAYNFFDNRLLPIPELRKNQFGATIGGPIKKDKLFFFAGYEGSRERIAESFFGTVPTELMRQGIFTEIPETIYNPFTTQACASCPSGVERTAFANNTIPSGPSGLISPVAAAYLASQWPLPTGPGIANNFAGAGIDRNTRNQINFRIDDSLPKDSIFGHYSFSNSHLYTARQTWGGAELPGNGDFDGITITSLTASETHTFSPTMFLQGQVSYFRLMRTGISQLYGDNLNKTLGIQGVIDQEPFVTNVEGMASPGSNPYEPEYRASNQYYYVGKLTKVAGKHTIRLGAEYQRWQTNMGTGFSYPQGGFTFDGTFTADPNAASGVATGFPFADFLLGYPREASATTGDSGGYIFRNNLRWWANDEFRVTPNFTLNVGLRWEYDGPAYEKFDRLSNVSFPSGDLVIAGQNFVRRSAGVQPDYHNYAPRLGLAYSIPGHTNTVIRAGYGIFYDVIRENGIEATRTNIPFSHWNVFQAGNSTAEVPTVPIQYAMSPTSAKPAAPSMEALDMHMYDGYQQQASFGIQHQFGSDWVAEVTYNWQKNTGFLDGRNMDAPLVNGTYILPYPQYSYVELDTNLEYGNYNALLMRLEKRFSHGVTALTSFTWSKYLDNDTAGDGSGPPGNSGFQNPYCFTCAYGRSASDFERRFVESFVYKIPTPTNYGAFARNLAGGWQVSGIFTYQSGFPVTPMVSFDNSESETYADHPDVVPGVPFFGPGFRTPTHWFNPAAFVVAPPKQFGNAGKGIINGPNLIDLDGGVMRNFRLSERAHLQFRAEFFNLPNHPNFADPNNDIDLTTVVGSITKTTTTSRQLQFALKLVF